MSTFRGGIRSRPGLCRFKVGERSRSAPDGGPGSSGGEELLQPPIIIERSTVCPHDRLARAHLLATGAQPPSVRPMAGRSAATARPSTSSSGVLASLSGAEAGSRLPASQARCSRARLRLALHTITTLQSGTFLTNVAYLALSCILAHPASQRAPRATRFLPSPCCAPPPPLPCAAPLPRSHVWMRPAPGPTVEHRIPARAAYPRRTLSARRPSARVASHGPLAPGLPRAGAGSARRSRTSGAGAPADHGRPPRRSSAPRSTVSLGSASVRRAPRAPPRRARTSHSATRSSSSSTLTSRMLPFLPLTLAPLPRGVT